MPDEIDLVQQNIELEQDSLIAKTRREAAAIPVGEPGTCAECDTYRFRLVGGICARCRDDRS